MHLDDMPIDDAYDYFGGPDLGEDFSHDRPHIARRHRRREVRDNAIATLRGTRKAAW